MAVACSAAGNAHLPCAVLVLLTSLCWGHTEEPAHLKVRFTLHRHFSVCLGKWSCSEIISLPASQNIFLWQVWFEESSGSRSASSVWILHSNSVCVNATLSSVFWCVHFIYLLVCCYLLMQTSMLTCCLDKSSIKYSSTGLTASIQQQSHANLNIIIYKDVLYSHFTVFQVTD